MLGAIAGDIIGSVYEHQGIKTKHFSLFTPASRYTDDTVLSAAIADSIMYGKDYASTLREYGRRYPDAGYGGLFLRWLASDSMLPYNSYGNGAAMRVNPVGFAWDDPDQVLAEAERSAAVTHNHPEGIKGAQAAALAILLARQGNNKEMIKDILIRRFGYDLDQALAQIRPHYYFDPTCQGSVPQAIISFLESSDYEDAVRNAVSLGGDSDTIACITGGIAEAYYKEIPALIIDKAKALLPKDLLETVKQFYHFAGLVWPRVAG